MVWSGESSRGARICCGRTEAHFGTPLTYPFGGLAFVYLGSDAFLRTCRYDSAPPGSRGLKPEVRHADQERTPRSQLLSRSVANVERAIRRRQTSNVAIALSAAPRNSSKDSVAMIRARADLAADFKRCCMLSGEFDGSDRDYYFR
jgi:hypothetical protein